MIDYSLLQREAEKTQTVLGCTKNQETAYGTRLRDLARAYHYELFADELIGEYLDELYASCENLLEEVQGLPDDERRYELTRFLNGVLDLCDVLDSLPFGEFTARLDSLEAQGAALLLRPALQAAA